MATARNNKSNTIKTLKQKYKQQGVTLQELFPDWSQEDLLFVVDECQGDIHNAINRISEGHATQWESAYKKPVVVKEKKPSRSSSHHKSSNKKNNRHRKEKSVITTKEEEEEQKPSWASILRGPTKPEEQSLESEAPQVAVVVDQEDIVQQEELVHKNIEEDIIVAEKVEEKEIVSAEEEEKVEVTVEEPVVQIEEEPQVQIIEKFIKTTIIKKARRALNQKEAVVLPDNCTPIISNINVQFGSLNLSNGEEVPPVDSVIVGEVVIKKSSPLMQSVSIPLPPPPPPQTVPIVETHTVPLLPPTQPLMQTVVPLIPQQQPYLPFQQPYHNNMVGFNNSNMNNYHGYAARDVVAPSHVPAAAPYYNNYSPYYNKYDEYNPMYPYYRPPIMQLPQQQQQPYWQHQA